LPEALEISSRVIIAAICVNFNENLRLLEYAPGRDMTAIGKHTVCANLDGVMLACVVCDSNSCAFLADSLVCHYGSGTLLYEGTAVSDKLQDAIVLDALKEAGLTSPDQQLPPSVRVEYVIGQDGRKLYYYFDYSSSPATITYSYGAGTDLLTGKSLPPGQ
jgi:hypothetical protein